MNAKSTSFDSFFRIKSDIKNGRVKNVYFLCGEETFFTDALQKEIIQTMPEDFRDFNMDILYGSEQTVDKIIGIARSFPMMSEKRIVIVREFFQLFSRSQRSSESEEAGSGTREEEDGDSSAVNMEKMVAYLRAPNPSTILVFVDKKSAGNTKVANAVSKSDYAEVLNFSPVPDIQLPEWIMEWTKANYNKKIEAKAAHVLAQRTGSDLLLLSTELDKLCTFKNNNDPITEDEVVKLVRVVKEISVFELKDALLSKNIDKTFQLAEQLLHSGKTTDVGETLRLIAFFYTYFSNIWQIQRLTQKGIPSKEIQMAVGTKSDYYFRNLVNESRMVDPARIPLIFEALLDADRSVKGDSKLDVKNILFIMLKRIIG